MGVTKAPGVHPPDPACVHGLAAVFRPRDLVALGLPRSAIRTWLRRGVVEAVSRGVYRRQDADLHELETLAQVAKRVPGGVFCLLTALHAHDIGTQSPPEVWIAIDRKARRPRPAGPRLRVVWFSPAMLRYGVEERVVQGVAIRLTSPARTVVDCFRYRHKIGLDVALEALNDALRRKRVTVAELTRAADVGRVGRVMRPYLEAVLA